MKKYNNKNENFKLNNLINSEKMMLTLIKEQSSKKFIKEMEKTYGSIKQLEKTLKQTNNMIMYVDLENWKYYLKNPDEKIERGRTIFTEDLTLREQKMKLLNFIKKKILNQ